MTKGVDFIGVGVGAIIRDQGGKYFLSQRGPQSRNEQGKWEFPGGSVDFGETLQQAIRRELEEEFGVVIEVGELVAVANHIITDESQHWVSPTFLCRIVKGQPEIMEPEKCLQFGWFTLSQIEEMISRDEVSGVVAGSVIALKNKASKNKASI